jgi:hypothetical protein
MAKRFIFAAKATGVRRNYATLLKVLSMLISPTNYPLAVASLAPLGVTIQTPFGWTMGVAEFSE